MNFVRWKTVMGMKIPANSCLDKKVHVDSINPELLIFASGIAVLDAAVSLRACVLARQHILDRKTVVKVLEVELLRIPHAWSVPDVGVVFLAQVLSVLRLESHLILW